MDKIAKFSRCMKELLISKEKFSLDKLYNIISRTEETSLFIDELMQAIVNIFEKYNIPIGVSMDRQKDRKIISKKWIVVRCYNYLLLNTCFPSQQALELDFLYGHGVNVWSNISPYLFIQIIWRLKYDEVLVESLQHIPLDLCVEILEVTIKCLVELENERAISLIFSLISRIYCKCLWLDWNVHLQHNVKEYLYQLVAHFQMLLQLFDNFNQSPDCHSKQRGTFLKRILRHTRLCMCKKFSSNMINPNVIYKADMYRLTFGIVSIYNMPTEIYHVFSNYEINSVMIILDRELVTLLLKQIQEIDHRECVHWAEIKDEEKPTISLQHAVAIECHNFMEYMKRDDFLVENDYLRQLLQQFINWSNFSSSGNSNKFSLTLQKLCDRIINSKPKYIRKLMKRYKEWDISTLNFINDRMHLLGKDNTFFLLKYLHHVFANSLNATERNQAYVSILIMLQRVNVINLHLNVLKYTKQHFHDNYLECMYDDNVFDKFIKNGISMHDPLKLRVLLIYILLNAKKVLTILVKIVIGYVDYRSPDFLTFTSCDLLSLQQFLCIEADGRYNLLLVILKEVVCFNNNDWHAEKLYNFISLMLRYQVIKIDELINYFCIPYLIMTDIKYNLYHIRIGLEFIVTELDYAQKMNYILLIVVLTKKMSLIRKNIEYVKEETNEMLSIACEILYKFPKHLETRRPALMQRKLYEYDYTIGNWLEPLDRTQMLMVMDGNMINVLHVIQNYETRCFPIYQKLRIDTRWKTQTNQIWKSIYRFTCVHINRESLIRHMMLHATASEFKLFVYGLTVLYYHFGWSSQLEAYENVVRIATEAVQLTIVYCTTFPPNAFYTLLRTLIKFCKKFATRSDANYHEAICRILLEALLSLELLMDNTQYDKLYSFLLKDVSKMFANKFYKNIQHYFRDVEKSMQICFNQLNSLTFFFGENFKSLTSLNDETNSNQDNNKLLIMYEEYCFICDCITLPSTETYGCTKYKFE